MQVICAYEIQPARDVGIAAAQQSPVHGHINPMDRRQKFVLTGEAGRIVRQKARWLTATSYGAITTRVAAREVPANPIRK